MVSFVIEGEPVPCARARVFSRGGITVARTPSKTRAFEHLVAVSARVKRPTDWRLDWASYDLSVRVYRATRKGDGDNYAKAIADGCTGVLWTNDSRIHRWVIVIEDDLVHPRTEVMVYMTGDLDLEADRNLRAQALAANGKKTKAKRR